MEVVVDDGRGRRRRLFCWYVLLPGQRCHALDLKGKLEDLLCARPLQLQQSGVADVVANLGEDQVIATTGWISPVRTHLTVDGDDVDGPPERGELLGGRPALDRAIGSSKMR